MSDKLSYSDISKQYESSPENGFRDVIREYIIRERIKIVILDDDPTGIQTVHGCLLLTNRDEKNLTSAFEDINPFFYILTNSRSMNAHEAESINRAVVHAVLKVNENHKFKLLFISRSDSTLRGHFPLEPFTISRTLADQNMESDFPVFFIPCFIEAGRYTINDTHYLKKDDELIPVNETEFALDNVFHYKSAHLKDYIIEKSESGISGNEIGSVSLKELKTLTINELSESLSALKNKKFVIVNALDYSDLYKFSLGFLKLISDLDNPVVIRSSSSLPKAISGIPDKPFLSIDELVSQKNQGIFVVGSHVNKTTEQLNVLLLHDKITGIEVNVQQIVNNPENYLKQIINLVTRVWSKEKTPVIYTSRNEIRIESKAERLNFGRKISDFLVSIVSYLPEPPAFVVAKGGITSHDILTKGLNIQFARVSGQIISGVPVIHTVKEHKFPMLPYIIFPGNVGDKYALKTVFEKLK